MVLVVARSLFEGFGGCYDESAVEVALDVGAM
jgi:hypothetical protein